ncbi:MAG: DUF3592 domain-containing protein [Clostridium sp.]
MQLTFLVFLSLILIALGIVILISKVNLDKLGVKGEGEVIDIVEDKEQMINPLNHLVTITVYKPLVKFTTEDGEEKKVLLDIIKKEGEFNIGDKINIIYPGSSPNNIIIHSKSNLYKLPTILISVGVMLMIFSIIIAVI